MTFALAISTFTLNLFYVIALISLMHSIKSGFDEVKSSIERMSACIGFISDNISKESYILTRRNELAYVNISITFYRETLLNLGTITERGLTSFLFLS